MKWLVRMGNTGVWGNDPGICKRKKDANKKSYIFLKEMSEVLFENEEMKKSCVFLKSV